MSDTRTKILDLAEGYTQERGFAGFSYLDIAKELDVTTASIHYHYKAKADLALALLKRLSEAHIAIFDHVDQSVDDPKARLKALIDHFEGYVRKDRICMCGMMAAEFHSVSEEVHELLNRYFKTLQNWVAKQLAETNSASPEEEALLFVSALEGALLLARLARDPASVSRAMASFVAE